MNLKNKILNFAVAGVLVSMPLYPSNLVKCPDTLSAWMKQNFTYQGEEEGIDVWKEPKKTRIDKGGDCEDFAFYVQAVLIDMGYDEVKVIHVFGKKSSYHSHKKGEEYSHAICVFKKDGYLRYFSNQYYISWMHFTTMEEVVYHACPKWKWWRELELPHKIKRKHYKRIKKVGEKTDEVKTERILP